MKVNCINAFNIEKLRENIEKFEALNGQKAYAFMSNDTNKLLSLECKKQIIIPLGGTLLDMLIYEEGITEFKDTKIYPDDDLPLGVVELR